ncbi:MAG: cobaltochelatase subunit CobN, partial [Pseudomonadota bacterium]|nr:cobaltochelatase subunit CobN [Pseudomonadota bacterium]
MHLLRVEDGGSLYDSDEAVDLGQPPGDIVVLTSADTEVSLLSAAVETRNAEAAGLDIRIANYLSLNHPFSVDSYLADTVSGAKLVVVRLLGGSGYWSYGVQELRALAESGGPPVAFLAGDGKPDPELDYLSTVPASDCHRLASYLDSGGPENASAFLQALHDLIDGTDIAAPPRPL